jgi:hypothetical protein
MGQDWDKLGSTYVEEGWRSLNSIDQYYQNKHSPSQSDYSYMMFRVPDAESSLALCIREWLV